MGSDCASAADRAPSSGWASRSRGSTTGLAPSSDATEKFTVSTLNPRGDGARLPGGVATAGAALNCTRLDGESPTPGGRGGVLTREMTGVVDAFVPSRVPSARSSSSAPATDRSGWGTRSRATRSTAPTSAFATVLACSVARSVAAAASASAIAFDAFACASESSRTATRFALAAASALAADASRAAAASASRSVSSSARNASDSSSIAAISVVKSTVVSAAVDAAGGGVGSMATVSASWTTTESRGR